MMALVVLDALRVASQQAEQPDGVVPLMGEVLDAMEPALG